MPLVFPFFEILFLGESTIFHKNLNRKIWDLRNNIIFYRQYFSPIFMVKYEESQNFLLYDEFFKSGSGRKNCAIKSIFIVLTF